MLLGGPFHVDVDVVDLFEVVVELVQVDVCPVEACVEVVVFDVGFVEVVVDFVVLDVGLV